MGSMPGYAVLPAVTEAIVEAGWTRAYPRIADVGALRHALYFAAYMVCVEFCVYWMHRLLHDIRIGYRQCPLALGPPSCDVHVTCMSPDLHPPTRSEFVRFRCCWPLLRAVGLLGRRGPYPGG